MPAAAYSATINPIFFLTADLIFSLQPTTPRKHDKAAKMCFGFGARAFQDYELEERCKTKHTYKHTSYVVPVHSSRRCPRCNGCECTSCHSQCTHIGYRQQPNMSCTGTGTQVTVAIKQPGNVVCNQPLPICYPPPICLPQRVFRPPQGCGIGPGGHSGFLDYTGGMHHH